MKGPQIIVPCGNLSRFDDAALGTGRSEAERGGMKNLFGVAGMERQVRDAIEVSVG
jgi:hypothetical protein